MSYPRVKRLGGHGLPIAIAFASLLAFSPAASAGTAGPGYTDSAVVSGLSQPTAIAFLPDGRLLITEKGAN